MSRRQFLCTGAAGAVAVASEAGSIAAPTGAAFASSLAAFKMPCAAFAHPAKTADFDWVQEAGNITSLDRHLPRNVNSITSPP
jgi:hypothetical protein